MEPQSNEYYRCRPCLYECVAIGDFLVDIDGTTITFFSLSNFSALKRLNLLSPADEFCAKLRVLDENHVILLTLKQFVVLNIETMSVTITVVFPSILEYGEAQNNSVVAIFEQSKSMTFWRLEKGFVIEEHKGIDLDLPDEEECNENNLEVCVMMSVINKPKIYLYWKKTYHLLEIDPAENVVKRFRRKQEIQHLVDIDENSYAEITRDVIIIQSKKGEKELAKFFNEGEFFQKVSFRKEKNLEFYSLSDEGLKMWKLEQNSYPIIFEESIEFPIDYIYLLKDIIVGINTDQKYILIWTNNEKHVFYKFPTEVIRRILPLNFYQVCLLLEATNIREVNEERQIEKFHKLEVFDFNRPLEPVIKTPLKYPYRIDIESAIVTKENNVRFILNEESEVGIQKKYLFRWNYSLEEKKQGKKREIIGAKDLDLIKLYCFERILTFKKPVSSNELYNVFNGFAGEKSMVKLYDFSATIVGEYELSKNVKEVCLTESNRIYAIEAEKIAIFKIVEEDKLEKIHTLEFSIQHIHCIGRVVLVCKENSILIYDDQFELMMNEQIDTQMLRILSINDKRIVTVSKKAIILWDLENECIVEQKIEGECDLSLIEILNENQFVVGKKEMRIIDISKSK